MFNKLRSLQNFLALSAVAFIVTSFSAYLLNSQKMNKLNLDFEEWKTYTNYKYKYAFKYPNTWNTLDYVNPIQDDSISNNVVVVSKYETNKGTLTPTSVLKVNIENVKEPFKDYIERVKKNNYKKINEEKYFSLHGVPALKLKGWQEDNFEGRITQSQPITVVINNGNIKGIISFENPSNPSSSYNDYIFDQILSTFKFTNQ